MLLHVCFLHSVQRVLISSDLANDGEPSLQECLKIKQDSNDWIVCNCTHPHDSICQKTPNEIPNGGRVNLLVIINLSFYS